MKKVCVLIVFMTLLGMTTICSASNVIDYEKTAQNQLKQYAYVKSMASQYAATIKWLYDNDIEITTTTTQISGKITETKRKMVSDEEYLAAKIRYEKIVADYSAVNTILAKSIIDEKKLSNRAIVKTFSSRIYFNATKDKPLFGVIEKDSNDSNSEVGTVLSNDFYEFENIYNNIMSKKDNKKTTIIDEMGVLDTVSSVTSIISSLMTSWNTYIQQKSINLTNLSNWLTTYYNIPNWDDIKTNSSNSNTNSGSVKTKK